MTSHRGSPPRATVVPWIRTAVAVVAVPAALIALATTSSSDDGQAAEASLTPSSIPEQHDVAPVDAELRMEPSDPVSLSIAAIDVETELVDLGLQQDGTMEVPAGAFPAGWYTGAPTPGEQGPAVIAGHVHWIDEEGVFRDLADVEVDDEIVVMREDESRAVFQVVRAQEFSKDEFPTDAVYGNVDFAGLRLITCAGLDDRSGRYGDNLVVFAKLIATS